MVSWAVHKNPLSTCFRFKISSDTLTHLWLDLTGEGDHSDEGGHQAGLQHRPVQDGAVRGAASEERSHCNIKYHGGKTSSPEPFKRLVIDCCLVGQNLTGLAKIWASLSSTSGTFGIDRSTMMLYFWCQCAIHTCRSWDDHPDCPSPTWHSTLAHGVYPGLARIYWI